MYPIDLKRLEHPAFKEHMTNADSRIKAGARFVFDALDIPLPDYLERKPAGRPFANGVMASFRKDNPETLHEATMRRSNEARARLTSKVNSAAVDTSFLG